MNELIKAHLKIIHHPAFRQKESYETDINKMSVCQYVSRLVGQLTLFSKMAYRKFLKLNMRAEGLNSQNLQKVISSERLLI